MSEKQLRAIIEELCRELDARGRHAVRAGVRNVVLPSALGVGLAVTGCAPMYAAPDVDAAVVDAQASSDVVVAGDAEVIADASSAPDAATTDASDIDAGPLPIYDVK